MSTNNTTHILSSAAAFTKTSDGSCIAVKIKQSPAGVKLLWKHRGEAGAIIESLSGGELNPSKTRVVAGIDPPGVAFYNIEVPNIPEVQLDSIVRMQAETILPLPLEQMEIAYHRGRVVADKCRITIAAGRSTQLKNEIAFAKECQAASIVLNSQAMVKVFATLFDIEEQRYVILNMRSKDTQVILSENGKLAHAAKLGIGADDINDEDKQSSEMFIYDLRNTLEMFGLNRSDEIITCVFSGSRLLTENIVAGLNDINILAKAADLKGNAILGNTEISDEEVCEYLDPIACALLAIDEENKPLDLFGKLLNNGNKKKKKISGFDSLIRAAGFFVVMLIATFFAFNQLNKMELAKYENDEIDKLVSAQKTRKLIAEQRPDIINLFAEINKDAPSRMMVDSISFKKGEKITLSSHASSHDQIIQIEKFLSSKKDFSDVTRQNPTFDEKSKKYAFKLNFHYKNWTRKSAR